MYDHDDPRITGEHIRHIVGSNGTVTLVGAVHDHPASVFRAKEAVSAIDPDVIALELPPSAIPIFERYADDDVSPPALGGEMSAAIQAGRTDQIVGIDGPSIGFLTELGRTLHSETMDLSMAIDIVSSLASATKRALFARGADVIAALTTCHLEVDRTVDHAVTADDSPTAQARDERTQISRAHGLLDAMQPSRAIRYMDATREAHMARVLAPYLEGQTVVAIVGRGHLDPVASRLATDS